jgi:hypothetical protein
MLRVAYLPAVLLPLVDRIKIDMPSGFHGGSFLLNYFKESVVLNSGILISLL